MAAKNYLQCLREPSDAGKPYTRWWWYGAAVDKDEIRRELRYMQQAGLGGVELQVMYPLQADDPDRGVTNHPFFSPGFFDVLQCALEECEQLGLAFDMTLGSSWPYGGPMIPSHMAPEILLPYQWDIQGPTTYSQDFTGLWAGDVVQASLVRMNGAEMEAETLRDITHHLEETWIYSWPYGHRLRELAVPEGIWKLTIMVSAQYRQRVGAPARGMDGHAMDHCRRDVTDFYLENTGAPLVQRFGKGRFRSFFCDSIELGGNNWTAPMFEEFQKRRGYDLKDYLPALWSSMGAVTPHIRYDYYRTMSELTIENFFLPLTEWSHKQGSLSRIQAHGTWADILKVYAAADIPEGETFGEGDSLMINTVHRRLASSAGNVYGRRVISNESFTWLRMPRFLVTLEMMKLAADAIFLDGINHIVNHGYAYSPPDADGPGHAFYASSLISHTNTWWEYYPELAAYMHRVSAYLQKGCNVAEVGLYIPQNDIWSETPMAELHMSMKIEQHITADVIQAIGRAGYWFNYLNDDVIQTATVNGDNLVIMENPYKVVLIPNCRYLPLGTAEALLRWVTAGGTVISLGSIPQHVPGLVERDEQQTTLNDIVAQLFGGDTSGAWHCVGSGRSLVVADYGADAAVLALQEVLAPDLQILDAPETVGYVHRRTGDEDVYFVANVSREPVRTRLRFKNQQEHCVILDPLHQTEIFPEAVANDGQSLTLTVNLEAGGSCFLIFASALPPLQAVSPRVAEVQDIMDISENWALDIERLGVHKALDHVQTWESIPGCAYHCGRGVYRKQMNLDSKQFAAKDVLLELEVVAEVADVRVNGQNVGVIWKRPYVVEISDHLVDGQNIIEVKVTNLWFNAIQDPKHREPLIEETILPQWPYFSEVINQIRSHRLHGWRERTMAAELQPSGIGGRIQLVFRDRVQ